MKRKLWAEEIALAISLRQIDKSWKEIAKEVGAQPESIKKAVKTAISTGYKHYPSRFGRTHLTYSSVPSIQF